MTFVVIGNFSNFPVELEHFRTACIVMVAPSFAAEMFAEWLQVMCRIVLLVGPNTFGTSFERERVLFCFIENVDTKNFCLPMF